MRKWSLFHGCKRKWVGYILSPLFTLPLYPLVSCNNHNDFPKPETFCQQTVLIFMPWADNLQSAFNRNIRMIEYAIRQHHGLYGQRLVVFRSNSPTEASLVEIIYGRDSCYHDTLKYYHDFRPMTVDGVAQVISDCRRKAPSIAKRYGLIMGCHGSGWLTVENWNRAPRRVIGGTNSKDQMDIADFAEGIARTGTKMEFICFDDCYMAGIETAYELRNVTTWLVGSTSEIMAYGLPYETIFHSLTAIPPDYASVMQGFYSFYTKYGNYPYGTFAAIDCREVETTAMIMRDINSQYTFDLSQLKDVQRLDGFAPTIFFDMGDYIDKLCTDETLSEQMRAQLERLVPYKVHTGAFFSVVNHAATPIETFSGITISDPSQNPMAVAGIEETGWWKATH